MKSFGWIVVLMFCLNVHSLDVQPKSLEGTQNDPNGLTDKQLAIQRYIAQLTFISYDKYIQNYTTNTQQDIEGRKGIWTGYYPDEEQLDLKGYRYPLSFMGYAVPALMWTKTSAYTELTEKILDNIIQRMLLKEVWKYIEVYWKNYSWFPDPVYYENIMYSGYLAQVIALYESISGNYKYSTQGWDWAWDADGYAPVHYNASQLMEVIFDQVNSEATGGVACEPTYIYIICNEHAQASLKLYDAIHKTSYSSLGSKWLNFVKTQGVVDPSLQKEHGFLKRDWGEWLPTVPSWPGTNALGTVGNDAWSLAYNFGYEAMKKSAWWTRSKEGGSYLDVDEIGDIFEFNDFLASSFYPIVAKECSHFDSREDFHVNEIYEYFEMNYGTLADLDNDGYSESYLYTCDNSIQSLDINSLIIVYGIWATANLVQSMTTDGASMDQMYNVPFTSLHGKNPKLARVDYPHVMVRSAIYDSDALQLQFELTTQTGEVVKRSRLVCDNINQSVLKVTVNGAVYFDYFIEDDTRLVIITDVAPATKVVISFGDE